MAGTLRTRSTLDTLFADNTAGDISAQDLRDLLWSTDLLPQITTTSSDASISAAAGNHYRVDISGFTQDRIFTLPTCSQGDQKIVMEITTGDDTYVLKTKGDTGVSIDGVTAADYSFHSAAGDLVVFEAIATNTWAVVSRTFEPLYFYALTDAGSQQSVPASTHTKLTNYGTVSSEYPSGIWDTTNGDVDLPCGLYLVTGTLVLLSLANDDLLQISFGTSTSSYSVMGTLGTGYSGNLTAGTLFLDVQSPDNYKFIGFHDSSTSRSTGTNSANCFVKLRRIK